MYICMSVYVAGARGTSGSRKIIYYHLLVGRGYSDSETFSCIIAVTRPAISFPLRSRTISHANRTGKPGASFIFSLSLPSTS